jgi:hypothetical protein
MKALSTLAFAALLFGGVAFTSIGCETSHSETNKPGLLGGNTHEETTTTKNPITGDVDTTHNVQKTN